MNFNLSKKIVFAFLFSLCSSYISIGQKTDIKPIPDSKPFIFTMQISEDDLTVKIPTNPDYTYSYNVDWGDNKTTQENGNAQHTYSVSGNYQIKVIGVFPAIYFFEGDRIQNTQLVSIDQWSDNEWKTFELSFYNCIVLNKFPLSPPNLNEVTDMSSMFRGARNFNQDISKWNVANVTNMNYLFYYAENFNHDISKWKVSNVTDMNSMFYQAEKFNQDISSWNVSKVTDMSWMFYLAENFNQNLSNWNVSKVEEYSDFSIASALTPENLPKFGN